MVGDYIGRLAPTPTGRLHLGHARTFHTAWKRAREANGVLIYRDEDIDTLRCKAEFSQGAMKDLRWLGLNWDAGPDIGGPNAPYQQSQRTERYLDAWHRLKNGGWIYPSTHSRKQLREATESGFARQSPINEDEQDSEAIFPESWRPEKGIGQDATEPGDFNWRFRVPDGEVITFEDGYFATQSFTAGEDFGDFLVWRRDGVPAYELAVVVDDIAMGITEVVRGADLLRSTARQLLIYRALSAKPPAFYHCPLVRDESGQRLAKRSESLSLQALRESGKTASDLQA
ncbi:glutamate--tRNA ligase family protein [Cerasicoccus maritimus]|uniref:glutamate--tRNA ligase family protein n=1 Tax=Cerasicoccus maritimus TaxID=490089 RepID=UPI0028528FBB|nr:glutamate--tRNA ligase family protein [Cerasicoccus maritimus]